MKQFTQQMVMIDGKPVARIRLTIWGVWCAAWHARKMLWGVRRWIWPLVLPAIFIVGMRRRTMDLPLTLIPPDEPREV